MHRTLSAAEAASLPEDVIVSVEGISRALPPPYKGVPRWLARVLPKSGLAGRTGQEVEDLLMDDEDEDEDDDDDTTHEPDDAAPESEILVLESDGRLLPFASVSPLAQALDRQLMFRRLHVATEWRDVADEAVRRTLGK